MTQISFKGRKYHIFQQYSTDTPEMCQFSLIQGRPSDQKYIFSEKVTNYAYKKQTSYLDYQFHWIYKWNKSTASEE